MARTVFLHLGLPKTATTYLQTILWNNRETLAEQGVCLPGLDRRDHFWASRIIRQDEMFELNSGAHRKEAWRRILDDVATAPRAAVISHEFFAAASAEQAARMVAELAPAEVHLVITGREPLGLFTTSWQEALKNRDERTMAEYAATPADPDNTAAVWNWRTLDIRLVLERWAGTVPAERVHVLPLPGKDAPRRLIWDRFAALVGVDPDSCDLSQTFPNTAMGVVEAETLRRMNAHLADFDTAIDRGTYIRSFIADQRLVPRAGERYWPEADVVAQCRQRGDDAVAAIRAGGYDVIGDLEDLRVPERLPDRRTPESVSDAEVAAVAVELAATLLHDVRRLRHERRGLNRDLARSRAKEDPGLKVSLVRRFPILAKVLSRETPAT